MALAGATIDLSLQNHTGAYSGADGYVDQASLSLAGSPDGLAEARCVSIVFHCRGDAECG
jgi:hypothetical protein